MLRHLEGDSTRVIRAPIILDKNSYGNQNCLLKGAPHSIYKFHFLFKL